MMKFTLLFFILLNLSSCGGDSSDNAESPQEQQSSFNLEVLMERSDVVWGFDFLPDNKIIFSERAGVINIFDSISGNVARVTGGPAVFASGEGGLLDLRVHPNFINNQLIYFCYAEANPDGARNALGRARLINGELTNRERIFVANEGNGTQIHFGCRIEFDDQNHLYLSLGERGNAARAQVLSSHLGKILRLNDDGSIPADNPFINQALAQPEIYSFGHRNVQGLSFRPDTNELWASELGPTGGDEVNIIQGGLNYGWPLISHGSGEDLIETTSRDGFVDPRAFWVPSISPSGIAFFKGDLFIATLSGQHVRRLDLSEDTVIAQEILFAERGWRFRNVRVGPDGILYFSTDEGRFGRVRE